MKDAKILKEFEISAGLVKVHQLKGKDLRPILQAVKKGGSLDEVEMMELCLLRCVTIDDKPLGMDQLDEMSASDYLALLRAAEVNFTTMSPAIS